MNWDLFQIGLLMKNKVQWNINQNIVIFIQENIFENIDGRMGFGFSVLMKGTWDCGGIIRCWHSAKFLWLEWWNWIMKPFGVFPLRNCNSMGNNEVAADVMAVAMNLVNMPQCASTRTVPPPPMLPLLMHWRYCSLAPSHRYDLAWHVSHWC